MWFKDSITKRYRRGLPRLHRQRILLPMINEAVYASTRRRQRRAIDTGMKLGANHPMGPLELATSSASILACR